MTILQSAPRRSGSGGRVAVLTDGDLPEVHQLVMADPIVNAVVASRLNLTGSLAPAWLGGTMLGIRGAGSVDAAVFSGGNLIPVGGAEPDWHELARAVAARPRVCTSIVGAAPAVAAMWEVLGSAWGPARAIRAAQPLLIADKPSAVAPDPSVRPAVISDLNRYMAASAAMFTDELGMSPYQSPGVDAYRARVTDLIESGHAFASFDFRGQVVFKADIGVVSAQTCQVQGVWVRPDLRGTGIGTAAMAAVIREGLALAPTVSLYVNDFNTPARRVYEKLGMRQHALLSTVLL